MLNAKEKWILFYKTFLKPSPEDAPYTPLDDLMHSLKLKCEEEDCVKLINKETAAIRLKEILIDDKKKVAVLLFQYSDTEIADPAFANLETGKLRLEPKLEGEGVAISAHMAISLEKEQKGKINTGAGTYLTLLEEVPGISRGKIASFLTFKLREVATDKYTTDEGKEKTYRPLWEMEGYLSETIANALEKGYLLGFELRDYRIVEEGLDEDEHIEIDSHTLKIKARHKPSGDVAEEIIRKVSKWGKKKGYPNMVVRYKRNEGREKSINASTAREDATEAVFAKFEKITISSPLPQCIEKIDDLIAKKMIKLLLMERAKPAK